MTDRDELLASKDRIISILEDQLEAEREARRRTDTIIAQLTQANATLAARVPELEAAQEPSEHAEEPAEGQVRVSPTSNDTAEPERSDKPWWKFW